jgi:hypothetical protein
MLICDCGQILQELSHDMLATSDKHDKTVANRIYNRFLSQMETGAVSRLFREDTPAGAPPQDEEWTRPRARPQSNT